MKNFQSCSTTTFGHLHSVKLTSLVILRIDSIVKIGGKFSYFLKLRIADKQALDKQKVKYTQSTQFI